MRRALLLLFAFFVAADALARVGGGDSFSGGGSGDGGGGEIAFELLYYLFRFLLWLTIEYPLIGIPADIVAIVLVVRWLKKRNKAAVVTIGTERKAKSKPAKLEALRRFDPNFSQVTFSDFCYSLYARAHHARGAGELDRYAPYLSENARNALRMRGTAPVQGIVVGAFQVTGVRGLDTPSVQVTVLYEANYTEGSETYYVKEQWVLERGRDILSPPPEKSKADHCPRCGAALQTRTDGSCEYCGVRISDGSFQWYVRAINLREQETRGPLLTSNVPERGTDRPTKKQRNLTLPADLVWSEFEQRVRMAATELQEAWTARDWERVRPLESEPLFQMHRYWIDAYRRQNLRNVVDGHRITAVEAARFESDAFYESLTVRLFAEGRDYTADDRGRVVAGSKEQLRKWSEYWTFIRTRTAQSPGRLHCPNCGAPVDAGATGICPYCSGKLTMGSFDWLLSRIEQDESYAG